MKFQIPNGNPISSDTETTGLYWRKGDRPYCFSFCNAKWQSEVLSFPVNKFTRQVKYDDRLDLIRDIYHDTSIAKVFHNASFDKGMIESTGLLVRGEIIDTMNLIRLVMPGAPIGLKPFCMRYLGISDDDERDLKEATRLARQVGREKGWKIFHSRAAEDHGEWNAAHTKTITKSNEDSELAPDYWLAGAKYFEKYCVQDSVRAMAVCRALWDGIKELGIEKLWINEQETFDVLRRIEQRGIRIYRGKVKRSKEDVKKKREQYAQTVKARIQPLLPLKVKTQHKGEERIKVIEKLELINLNSSQQLSAILYDNFREPIRYLTEKGQNPSTDNAALSAMKTPIAKDILNIKACEKTLQFMDQYLHFMVQHKDGLWYIHPTFHQALTVTGRESCSDPNLQQVAKGRDNEVAVRVEARSVFGPRPDYWMRSFDWKNIEVFIPAFPSGDKKMIKILRDGGDLHAVTAASLAKSLGKPLSSTEEDSRDLAKRTFFGMQYGIGEVTLSKTLRIDVDKAALIMYGIKSEYPDFFAFLDDLIMQARKYHYIKTAYGRKIFVDPREAYKAPNYYVQGTAGGILKFAKVKVDWALRKKDAHMVLPIHDELLLEVGYTTNMEVVDRIIVDCMQDNPELHMPVKIPVSISRIGSNWSKKEKVRVAA